AQVRGRGRAAPDSLLVAQHAGRRADLRLHHVHRSRRDRRVERQGDLPRSLAPIASRRARLRRSAGASRGHRSRAHGAARRCDREPIHARDRGGVRAGRREGVRRAAHDARGDFRRECDGEPQGAGRMSASIVGRLIAKDLYLLRPMMIGALVIGGIGVAVLPFGETEFLVGWVILFITVLLLGIFSTTLGVITERKEKAHLFVLTLPTSPTQYTLAKLAANGIAFLVPWTLLSVAALSVIVAT